MNFYGVPNQAPVRLDEYVCDLNLELSTDGYSCTPMSNQGFSYMWAGAKANYGVRSGNVCYEVKILEYNDIGDCDQDAPHVARLGWSTDRASLQLGEDICSFGFGGTGVISYDRKFTAYGIPYGKGDVIACYLHFQGGWILISYSVNGRHLGDAFKMRWSSGEALFPHILTKNCQIEVNFGQMSFPYYSIDHGFKLIAHVRQDLLVPSLSPPTSQDQCEVIMMVGLPGVGKTTWAMDFAKKNPHKKYFVLGTDSIIEKMRVKGLPRKNNFSGRWEVLIKQATECFNKLLGKAANLPRNLILDQTNVYSSARRRKVSQYRKKGFTVNCMVLVPTDEEMKSRSLLRTKENGKEVPETALLDMKANFTLPVEQDKLFDDITFLELQRSQAQSLVEQYNDEAFKKGKTCNKPPMNKNPARSNFYNSSQPNSYGAPMKEGGDHNFNQQPTVHQTRGGYPPDNGNYHQQQQQLRPQHNDYYQDQYQHQNTAEGNYGEVKKEANELAPRQGYNQRPGFETSYNHQQHHPAMANSEHRNMGVGRHNPAGGDVPPTTAVAPSAERAAPMSWQEPARSAHEPPRTDPVPYRGQDLPPRAPQPHYAQQPYQEKPLTHELSDIGHPPMRGPQPSLMDHQPIFTGQQAPLRAQQPPLRAQHAPLRAQQPTLGAQHAPLRAQQTPLGAQHAPSGAQHAPLGAQHAPLGAQQAPLRAQQPTLRAQQPTLRGQQPFVRDPQPRFRGQHPLHRAPHYGREQAPPAAAPAWSAENKHQTIEEEKFKQEPPHQFNQYGGRSHGPTNPSYPPAERYQAPFHHQPEQDLKYDPPIIKTEPISEVAAAPSLLGDHPQHHYNKVANDDVIMATDDRFGRGDHLHQHQQPPPQSYHAQPQPPQRFNKPPPHVHDEPVAPHYDEPQFYGQHADPNAESYQGEGEYPPPAHFGGAHQFGPRAGQPRPVRPQFGGHNNGGPQAFASVPPARFQAPYDEHHQVEEEASFQQEEEGGDYEEDFDYEQQQEEEPFRFRGQNRGRQNDRMQNRNRGGDDRFNRGGGRHGGNYRGNRNDQNSLEETAADQRGGNFGRNREQQHDRGGSRGRGRFNTRDDEPRRRQRSRERSSRRGARSRSPHNKSSTTSSSRRRSPSRRSPSSRRKNSREERSRQRSRSRERTRSDEKKSKTSDSSSSRSKSDSKSADVKKPTKDSSSDAKDVGKTDASAKDDKAQEKSEPATNKSEKNDKKPREKSSSAEKDDKNTSKATSRKEETRKNESASNDKKSDSSKPHEAGRTTARKSRFESPIRENRNNHQKQKAEVKPVPRHQVPQITRPPAPLKGGKHHDNAPNRFRSPHAPSHKLAHEGQPLVRPKLPAHVQPLHAYNRPRFPIDGEVKFNTEGDGILETPPGPPLIAPANAALGVGGYNIKEYYGEGEEEYPGVEEGGGYYEEGAAADPYYADQGGDEMTWQDYPPQPHVPQPLHHHPAAAAVRPQPVQHRPPLLHPTMSRPLRPHMGLRPSRPLIGQRPMRPAHPLHHAAGLRPRLRAPRPAMRPHMVPRPPAPHHRVAAPLAHHHLHPQHAHMHPPPPQY